MWPTSYSILVGHHRHFSKPGLKKSLQIEFISLCWEQIFEKLLPRRAPGRHLLRKQCQNEVHNEVPYVRDCLLSLNLTPILEQRPLFFGNVPDA